LLDSLLQETTEWKDGGIGGGGSIWPPPEK